MAGRTCNKCGETNPRFFTHCVKCGAALGEDHHKDVKTLRYLKIGLLVCVSLLLVWYVIFMVVPYSQQFAQNLSETVSAPSDSEGAQPVPVYPLNSPAEDEGLRVTIRAAQEGDILMDSSKKAYTAEAFLENGRTRGTFRISGNLFALVDTNNTEYYGYLDEPQLMYDLGPGENRALKIKFIIPRDVTPKKVRVTFPGTSAFASTHTLADFAI